MSDMLGHYDIIYDTIRHFLHATTNSIISDIPSDINDYECTTEGFYNDVCRLLSLSVFFLSVPGKCEEKDRELVCALRAR